MSLSDPQNKLYWRLWAAVRKVKPDSDRKAMHAQVSADWPTGLPESHTHWKNPEMDEWVSRCKAITNPESYTAQRKQVKMPQTRWLTAIGHLLTALEVGTDYAEGIARQMNLRGALGGELATLETIKPEGLESIFVALKIECRKKWPGKPDLLNAVYELLRSRYNAATFATICAALAVEKVPNVDKLVYEKLLVVLSVLLRMEAAAAVPVKVEEPVLVEANAEGGDDPDWTV